ncbi:MAG: cytochrome c [Gammaproteobacteria bacterium]|nr:cytochrome c [Gammaproteobacteria bacterium]
MLSIRKGTLRMALMSTCLAVASAQAFEGDPQRGRIIADTCLGCHAIPSYSNVYPYYHVPKVGGQNEAYLVSALLAYRKGDRAHGTMHNNALSLSDQDIADIAAFFSSAGK